MAYPKSRWTYAIRSSLPLKISRMDRSQSGAGSSMPRKGTGLDKDR